MIRPRFAAVSTRVVVLVSLLVIGATARPAPWGADDCPPGIINTIAGGGVCDNVPATDCLLAWPDGVTVGPDGDLYVCDSDRVRKVDAAGIITTVAGGGDPPDGVGDGGPATEARVYAYDAAFGADGSLYICGASSVRRVDPAGIITTVAGQTWHYGFYGDGGPATEAALDTASGVAVGADGSIYIADTLNHRIRKIDPAGFIDTVAGSGPTGFGQGGYSGDGGPATDALLNHPRDVAVGADGSLYIADTSNHRIRKVDPAGTITTVAGNGEAGFSGDGGPATEASLHRPYSVALAADGSLYLTGYDNHRIRRIDPAGIITTVAGSGPVGYYEGDYAGDGGPATAARLNRPTYVTVAADGTFYIADTDNHRVRRVDPAGIIDTVAGNGQGYYCGEGVPATQARLSGPEGVAMGADGSIYIADVANQRVRRVGPDGIIATVAGDGWEDEVHNGRYAGDGGPATEASLHDPVDVAVGPDGSLYIADYANQRIRKVDTAGIMSTFAGNGIYGFSGDGGPATEASLRNPSGVAAAADGSVYIADCFNQRVRKVDPAGIITTVAGSGPTDPNIGDFAGDGGPATEARFNWPHDVAVGADGSLYIADARNLRIRKVDPAGIITTVAGNGDQYGALGDGGPATQASLYVPFEVALGPDGSIYIADREHERIRRVSPAGIISTVAGDGTIGFSGDGGPATEAQLRLPMGVAVGSDGSIYIGDTYGDRVRKVCALLLPPTCDITHAPELPLIGELVSFDSQASDPDGGDMVEILWDFGDGSIGAGLTASHSYALAGTYEVVCTATDDEGDVQSCSLTIAVVSSQMCFSLIGNCRNLISLPGQAINPDPWDVFDELRPPNKPVDLLSGNLARYDEGLQGYVIYYRWAPSQFGPIAPGEGYWLWSFFEETICYDALPWQGAQARNLPVASWYLVGSPHAADCYLDDTLWSHGAEGPYPFSEIMNLWVQDPLVPWSCVWNSYGRCGLLPIDGDHYLRAFQGYWLYTFVDDVTMEVPTP